MTALLDAPEIAVAPPSRRFFHYRDADGRLHELIVTSAQFKAFEAYARLERRREVRYRKANVTFTDVGKRGNRITEEEAAKRKDQSKSSRKGYPWEGPRYEFTVFLGLGTLWPLGRDDQGRCAECRGRKLPEGVYCLGDDRCGMDWAIPRPTSVDLEKRREEKAPVEAKTTKKGKKLKGGKG